MSTTKKSDFKIQESQGKTKKTPATLDDVVNAIGKISKNISTIPTDINSAITKNNKEQENKEQNINNNGNNSKRYARPQSFGIKNRNILTKQGGKNYDIGLNENNAVIIEQDNIIKKLKEKIAHLEKDNAGLLIRLKNNNNLKTIKK
jgi:septal ring factor EnvC (AmiA/AmiB activator)